MSEYGDRLFPHHQEELRASAIDPVVARERGYVSVDTKAEMERRGFGSSQRNVPALLLPLHRVDGEVAGYQAKPDEPRAGSDGRPIKYETPSKQKLVVDVHPRIRDEVRSGHGPLFITEGVKKADAAISAELTCVALLGVFSWRGRTDDEALTALADWELINLRDRQVFVCFDSDIALKPQVREAMVRLKAFLQMRGAEVAVIYLPSGPAGVKVGLDDFLASGRTVDEMLSHASVEVRPAQAPKLDEYADVPDESGAQLLDDVAGFIRRYLALPSDAELVALVLWVVHTWVIDAFDTTPRLNVTSPEKGSGKTRVLEVLEKLCRNAAMTVNMSVAFLFRLLDAEENLPTLLFDEVDTVFTGNGKHDELRGVLNAGYRRGASVGRVVGEGTEMTTKLFRVFAPVAMAGIGSLPDTLADRSVPIKVMRRRPDQKVEQFRERSVLKASAPLVQRLGAWGSRNAEALRDAEPDLPEGIVDRPADVWEPLIAVADQAGGQWPELARAAAVKLNETRRTDDASPGVKLLADIRQVFVERDVDRISTEELRIRLAQMDESDWVDFRGDPLTPRALAKLLVPFGIKPMTIRFGAGSPLRGYRDSQFAEAWASYLPTPLPEAQQAQQPQHSRSEGVEMLRMGGHVADTEVQHAPDSSPESAPLASDVADVAFGNGTRNGHLCALTRDVADVADVAGISEGEDPLRVGDREVIEL